MSLNLYVFLVAYVARLAVTEVLRVAPGGVVVIAICCNSFSAMPLGERSLEVVAHGCAIFNRMLNAEGLGGG